MARNVQTLMLASHPEANPDACIVIHWFNLVATKRAMHHALFTSDCQAGVYSLVDIDTIARRSFIPYLQYIIIRAKVDVQSADIDIQTANVSWNPSSQPFSLVIEDINQIYTLTVTSNNTHPQTPQLHQPFYIFNAPDCAPPCEVYNFSVTATYVGATYTGAGCSVPSPVLSRMLPSFST